MRFACILAGWFFLGVGVAGVFLPLLPTTPFLLLSSFFFVRGSPRTHRWLMNHRLLGRYVRDWHEKRGVRPSVKITAFAMLAAATAGSTFFGNLPAWALVLLYVLTATGAIVVWRLPTVRDSAPVPVEESGPA